MEKIIHFCNKDTTKKVPGNIFKAVLLAMMISWFQTRTSHTPNVSLKIKELMKGTKR